MKKQPLFRGTAPALVTPFTPDLMIDESAFKNLIDMQIGAGVEAIVVLGTTGENPTIDPDERKQLVELSISHTAGRVPVIIGTGTNNTHESTVYSKEAEAAGADGLLVVGPYYNKPTQEGYFAHVQAIAGATDCPIILYNVPGRTGSNISAETTLRIAEEIPSVSATKEASGSLEQIAEILRHRPENFAVYSGDDEFTLPLLALGADGVISVVCNALPGPFSDMVRAGLNYKFEQARKSHFQLLDAMRYCFIESNPVPVKTMLAELGMMDSNVRMPLVPLTEQNHKKITDLMQRWR